MESLSSSRRRTALLLVSVLSVSPLFADTASDAALSKSPFAGSAFGTYTLSVNRVEQERTRAIINLNEKLLTELARAKSAALKSERLDEANIIEAKIKEVTEATAALKGSGGKPVVSTVSTGKVKSGAAKLVADFVASAGDKLSDTQKRVLGDILDGKAIWFNDQHQPFGFDKDGNLFIIKTKGSTPVRVEVGSVDENGNLSLSDNSIYSLTGITATTFNYTWRGRGCRGTVGTSADLDAYLKGKPATAHGKTDSDPDNTIFGKRTK